MKPSKTNLCQVFYIVGHGVVDKIVLNSVGKGLWTKLFLIVQHGVD